MPRDYRFMYRHQGAPRHGCYDEARNIFPTADEAGVFRSMFRPTDGINYISNPFTGKPKWIDVVRIP